MREGHDAALSPNNITGSFPRYVSLRLDGITTTNLAALQHRCVHSHVSAVMLGSRAEYPRVLGEISLGERCHHAARARTGDFQANGVPNCDHLSNPTILDESPFASRSLHHHIRSESPGLKAPWGYSSRNRLSVAVVST